MTLNASQFLDHNVEEFLIKDLEAMIQGSRVCYPIVMTACAGIELLGSLFSDEFNSLAGSGYFRRYWTQYLYPTRDHTREMGDALYTLVRNGLSHMFLPAEQIGVTGARPHAHLTRDSHGRVIIDAHQLAKDFIRSYRFDFKPLIAGSVNFGAQLRGSSITETTPRVS